MRQVRKKSIPTNRWHSAQKHRWQAAKSGIEHMSSAAESRSEGRRAGIPRKNAFPTAQNRERDDPRHSQKVSKHSAHSQTITENYFFFIFSA
jgi:hypothetical protein